MAGSAFLASFFVGHMMVLEKYTDFLYLKAKVLKRRTPKAQLTSERRYIRENMIDYFFLTLTPLIVLVYNVYPTVEEHGFDFSFKLRDVLLSTIAVYFWFDTIYYIVHRMLHEVPFLYRTIHKRHHEDSPVHMYLTGHAHYLENLMAASPGLALWVCTVLYFFSSPLPNFWTIVLPALTLTMEFNTAHAGYYDHFLLYAMSPLQWMVKALPYARWLASEHEEHHLLLKKNYQPVFKWFDMMGGTNSVPEPSKYKSVDIIEKRAPSKSAD
ncbi:hypothetical protein HDU85_004092 [Gaertneriomyces sp. JEL0708]|nr:hypothetical protein HDU85_004092 [Gaertneriomyces sp. JEL0708]